MLLLQQQRQFTRYYKSIASNKSFISAASSKKTKVLNEAAVAGKIDYLEGLKM
jgi:hypothetical protein